MRNLPLNAHDKRLKEICITVAGRNAFVKKVLSKDRVDSSGRGRKRTFSAELPAQRNLGKTDRQKQRKFPPISSNVNKSYSEPAVTKANLPAAIQDNKKKTPLRGGGNIGKTFHERADSFTQTNAKNEVTNRKKKGARRKDQEKKDESSFTDMVNKCKSLEGMKAKFPLKTMVRNECFSSHMAH